MMKDVEYSEDSVRLASGDILVLYSDGVTEARNKDGQLFGVERLHEIVHKYMEENRDSINAQQLLDRIYAAVCDFSPSMLLTDDLTIVILCSV